MNLSGIRTSASLPKTFSPSAELQTENSLRTTDLFERSATNGSVSDNLPLVTPALSRSVSAETSSQETPLLRGTPLAELNEFPAIKKAIAAETALNLQPGNRTGFVESAITPAKGVVLGLHGWSAGTWQFEHIADQLAAQGYHVYVPRLPGHGIIDEAGIPTSRDFPVNRQMARYSEFADKVYSEAASLGLPVHTIGLSGGGAVALDIAGRHDVASSMLYDPFLSPGDPTADTLMTVFNWLDRFTFGMASLLLRLLPIVFEGPKEDIQEWGRHGHVNFNAAQIFTLTHYGRQAIDNAKNSTSPIQIIGTEFEPGVVSHSRLKEVAATGENRKLYTFDAESNVPHAMIHWREFKDDAARAQVRALTFDFLENQVTSEN